MKIIITIFPILSPDCGICEWQAFYSFVRSLPAKTNGQKCAHDLVISYVKNCRHFAKLQVPRNSSGTDCGCICYSKTMYSWIEHFEQ